MNKTCKNNNTNKHVIERRQTKKRQNKKHETTKGKQKRVKTKRTNNTQTNAKKTPPLKKKRTTDYVFSFQLFVCLYFIPHLPGEGC